MWVGAAQHGLARHKKLGKQLAVVLGPPSLQGMREVKTNVVERSSQGEAIEPCGVDAVKNACAQVTKVLYVRASELAVNLGLAFERRRRQVQRSRLRSARVKLRKRQREAEVGLAQQ
eukprot:CAMPEP_0172631072 /NCGR_PEP_ID=MMETSP1068-20121228/177083_1 /TAXON_ID=35684 /ORGANISM="Pseudopedinella elastica, Strain CCMP716" /LENGTH=116 /DNA_ID=CAMNT_0013442099 /DNA_START=454 /DNA_END=804 /DNA_ORIENTATION=+